jgi:hypothetical protein
VSSKSILVQAVLALLLTAFSSCVLADLSGAEPQSAARDFNHFQTGFPLTGAHLTAECGSCHVGGAFKGTPRNCAGCHAKGARVVATAMPSNHVVTTDPCEVCHTSTATFLGARFNHSGAAPGTCVTCHSGRIAAARPSSHNGGLRLADSCEKCHRTTSWFPAYFDHTGIAPGTCTAQCHNGTLATARPASHTTVLKATSSCDACHHFTAWFPTFYNHAAVAPGTCSTCHNGSAATGRPSAHTGAKVLLACDSCHTTTAWLPGTYRHIGVVAGGCLMCHMAQRPTSHSARGYFASCDACHSIGSAWTFNHALQQGKHTCNSCHSGHHNTTPCDYCHNVNKWG